MLGGRHLNKGLYIERRMTINIEKLGHESRAKVWRCYALPRIEGPN
jgi:hypothetical protein